MDDIALRPGALSQTLTAHSSEPLENPLPDLNHRHHVHHHHHHHHHHHPFARAPDDVDGGAASAFSRVDKEKNCLRGRPEEEDSATVLKMSPQLIGKTVTPFLKDHIPGLYAPVAKPEVVATASADRNGDLNSRYCYRHRPDSKCRKAADESKMALIQSELELLTPADQQAITHVWSLFSAAPFKHRNLMLQGIMTQCCFPQLSSVAREVQDQLKIDFLTVLPLEISLRILGFLDAVSLCRAAQVSRQWSELADQDHVWSRICIQHIDRKCLTCGFGLPLLERKRLREWNRQRELAEMRQGTSVRPRIPSVAPSLPAPNTPKHDASDLDGAPEPKRRCASSVGDDETDEPHQVSNVQERRFKGWKSVYKERFRVGYNWKWGIYTMKIFKGHTNGVTCLQMDDTMLATGSYDATIRLWDIESGAVIRELRGHTRGIRAIQFDEKILVSGSLDGTVRIWNHLTGELLNTLAGHSDGVISVNFDREYLASGSIDRTIKIFNLWTKESFTLKGHTDWINCVRICNESRTMFSASDDCSVKLWDLDSRKCIRTFEGHVGHCQQVLPLPFDFEPDEDPRRSSTDNADAPSATSGGSITGHKYDHVASSRTPQADMSTEQPEEELRAAYGARFVADETTPLPARYILTSALDSTIRCWDTSTGRCVRTFFGHLEGIWALCGDSLRVVSGANDATVKVWDPRSGKCERTFTGHMGPVTSVALSDSRLASGGEDGVVRMYSFQDGLAPRTSRFGREQTLD